jgi:hypothetical protein
MKRDSTGWAQPSLAYSFAAAETTRLRQGYGVVHRCMIYFGAKDSTII